MCLASLVSCGCLNGRMVALLSGSISPVYIDGKLCRSFRREIFANDNYVIRGFDRSDRILRRSRLQARQRYTESKKVIVQCEWNNDYFFTK